MQEGGPEDLSAAYADDYEEFNNEANEMLAEELARAADAQEKLRQEKFEAALKQAQDEIKPVEHLFCGHCGGVEDVRRIDFLVVLRYLCINCRNEILRWI
jgi:rubrerythrin